MGEAKRRRDYHERLLAEGHLVPRPDRCPSCGSSGVIFISPERLRVIVPVPDATDAEKVVELAGCRKCRAIWEPFPALYQPDEVAAEPCDNCAFRPGSPEQADPESWRQLTESLRPDGKGWFRGRFYCHKNVPFDMAHAGDFMFPRLPDGAYDKSKMRSCSGFLRMFWALNKKASPSALEASDVP